MFIQTEATPNPATLKFLPGREVLSSGTAEFREADDAVALKHVDELALGGHDRKTELHAQAP